LNRTGLPPATSLPWITVITPSYNQANTIGLTIESVLGQNYPNLEYMIIDGGSTDGTIEILKHYDGRFRWISEKDDGQSNAINKGLRISKGDILTFLNSDDIYEPEALLKVGLFFSRHPEAKWVTGRCHIIDREGRKISSLLTLYKNIWFNLQLSRILFVLNFISQPATFWHKEVTNQIGYFNESLKYALDYEYWLRILQITDLFFINSYLASFRYYPNSKSGSATVARFNEQFQVAQKNTSSSAVLRLHRLHNLITIFFYQHMFKPT
jgi:glycosyltransferase involved in cell wall biosynthesis